MIKDGLRNLVVVDNANFYYSSSASEGATWSVRNPASATVGSGKLFKNASGTVFYANGTNELLQFNNSTQVWTESVLNYPTYYYLNFICSPESNVLVMTSSEGPANRSTDN